MTGVLVEEIKTQTHTPGRPCGDGGRSWPRARPREDTSQPRRHLRLQPPELGENPPEV